jgi:urease accessory protein
MKKSFTTTLLLSALTLVPTLAHAHPGPPGHHSAMSAGLMHPLTGLDHLLAMIAVGMWASQLGGRARWAVPVTFMGVMTLGSILGMLGLRLPAVELAIFASVVLLGLLVAGAARMRLEACMAAVGFFAFFHGLAHGVEIPATANGFGYAAGFIIATGALHALGFGIAAGMKSFAEAGWVRAAGGAIAVAGMMLVAS